jgi:hypothetical protein
MTDIDNTFTSADLAEYRRRGIKEPKPVVTRKIEAHAILSGIRKRILAQRVIQPIPTPACPRSLELPTRIREAIAERFAAASLDVVLIPMPNSILVQCGTGGRRYVIPHCTAWARMMDIVDETVVEMQGGVDPGEQEQLAWNAYLNRLHEIAW